MSKPNETLKHYWRTVSEAKPRLKVLGQESRKEFRDGQQFLVTDGASRRKFMGLLGASTALAGLTSGCLRKPKENIMPFATRPEDLVPGKPMHYATAGQFGSTVLGLVVECHDGRPTKIAGNPGHPASNGKTDVQAQASVLGFYDPERSQKPMSKTRAAYATADEKAVTAQGANPEEAAKEAAAHQLCQDVEAAVLEASNSIDRAKAAAEACIAKIEGGEVRWDILKKDGKVTANAFLDADELGPSDWGSVWNILGGNFRELRKSGGEGLGLVVDGTTSPTYKALLKVFKAQYPKARVFMGDPTYPANSIAGAELIGGEGARTFHNLRGAQVILAADSDFLGTGADHTRLTGEYAEGRKIESPSDTMNRLYVAEPHMTTTGAQADNRLRVRGSEVGTFLMLVATKVREKMGGDEAMPRGSEALFLAFPSKLEVTEEMDKFAGAVADDLVKNKSKCAVIVGERQPPAIHAVGLFLNMMLRNLGGKSHGSLIFKHDDRAVTTEGLDALASALAEGEVDHVVCLGTNPAYDAPGTLGMTEALSNTKLLVHAGLYLDETGQIADWHLPVSHFLEAWGDLESTEGAVTIQQPMIEPLWGTPSMLEVLARIVHPDGVERAGHEQVRGYWDAELARTGGLSERRWRQWLHDGIATGLPRPPRRPVTSGFAEAGEALKKLPGAVEGHEVNFHLDPALLAGEYSNNAWLQELPHPINKIVWDNAAFVCPSDAEEMGIQHGDFVDIKAGDRTMSLPACIAPGQAKGTVSVNLGYGRRGLGQVAEGVGGDINPLRSHEAPYFEGGKITRGAGSALLVRTQTYSSLDPDGTEGTPIGINYDSRPIYRETDKKGFKKDPDFAKKGDLMPPERIQSLWDHPELTGKHQWGMSIDLNSCTGCNACTIACMAENNIPVVGKDECANGRELHWIRIDRYYSGDLDEPQAVVQPVACQHCETAPCESVCPVQATSHSPEGLNDMAYNRCVGTRYCANNCPYKVRRFNFFNYQVRELDSEVEWMKHNPDVTVRFRGVIEKCTYCVQRIQEAKIGLHVQGEDEIPDGTIVTACEEVCPANAIVFGNIADPDSRVSKAKKQKRDYGLLTDLNTVPRTSYLGRVRNPNPKLS